MVKKIVNEIYEEVGADALLISQEDLRFYLTGFKSSSGIVFADKNGISFYTDARYIEAARKHFEDTGVQVKEYPKGFTAVSLLTGYKTVAVPFDRINANEYAKFISEGYKPVDCMEAFVNKMAVKRPDEIAKIKRACEITDKAFYDLLPLIKEGMTENDVAAQLEFLMRKHGASGTSFDTICAFGANGSVPHHETGSDKLKFGDAVLIDFGCKESGYCSDCTRTFLFGDDKKHEEFKDYYNKVLEAQTLVKEKFTSGMTGVEGDAIARDYLAKYDLAQYFTHSLGHSLGINIHEAPGLSPRDGRVFCDGMVFSDEPGIYMAGKLGIRIEDTVTLRNGKVVSLTESDKKLIIV